MTMAITTMNAMSEIDSIINPPATPDLKRDAEGRFIAADPAKEAPKEVGKEADGVEEAPEWVKRGNISPEQKKIVEEVIQRAIGKKHAQAKDAEEFAAEQYNEKMLAEQRATSLEREIARLKAATPEKSAPDPAQRPERASFATDEAYIEAVADWKTEQKFNEREQKAIEEREQARQQEVIRAAVERVDAARQAVPDYDEVVGAADIAVPAHIATYMQESELFAEMGYHFAKHPEDLKKISLMPTKSMLDLQRLGVALAKIEGKLSPFAAPAKASNGHAPSDDEDGDLPSDTGSFPSRKPRAAAPVIQPLSMGSGNQVEKRESAMSYDEARSAWEKRNRRDFSRRSRH